jgi:isopropylmalate/homocitrate/citramalate synthase
MRSPESEMERAMEPWHTDEWFTSPWNFAPEIRERLHFPDRVIVHDVTLRDGEQQAGVEFSSDDKLRIADALAAAGVQRIEAGLPAVSPSDERAVREIAARGLPCEVWAFSRCLVDDVKRALDCGVAGVVMEIPSSHHIVEWAYRWPLERAVDLAIEATQLAHEHGLQVSFFPIDATRASIVDFLDLIERVARDGWMDALGLVDTFGVLAPQGVDLMVRKARERVTKPLETHFHMDYSLGVANTIFAVASGAEVIQTTVTALGERAGNTPMEETVLALRTMFDIDLGIDTKQFASLSNLVLERSGVTIPSNRPVVGKRLFNVESGIITTWIKNASPDHLLECVPFLPSLVGQEPVTPVLGKGSGLDSVVVALDALGLEATAEEMGELLVQVKARSLEIKGTVALEDFAAMAQSVIRTQGRP